MTSGRVPSTGKPEFVMAGISRPGGGIRLYASRDVKATNWGLSDQPDLTSAWHIDADMQHVLVIDAPSWGEAFAKAFEIWSNADKETARRELENRSRELTRAKRAIRAELGGEVPDARP